jgi:3-deoxy-manno-octulosonate cytidylyltransferase (CMP-KDO synthetase)
MMRLKPIIIIPARYNSSRFPGKMLEKLGDKTVLEQTIETGKRTGLPVYVATDNREIANLCIKINQEYVMTDTEHKNGTERVAEAMIKLIDKHGQDFASDFDYVINLQGDSPLIPDYVFKMMMEEYETLFANDMPFDVITPTFRMPMETAERFLDCRAEGKAGGTTVVANRTGRAIYFSKEMIPYGADLTNVRSASEKIPMYYHIGMYAYKPSALFEYSQMEETALEKTEGLEQLRFVENGYHVHCMKMNPLHFDFWEVNNPEDIEIVENSLHHVR